MRLHAPHAFAMGKRDVGSDAPTRVSLLSYLGWMLIWEKHMRRKIDVAHFFIQ